MVADADRTTDWRAPVDAEVFGRLVEPYLHRMLGAATLVLGDPHEAEDILQESLVAAWQGLSQLRDRERFPNWFRRIVIRKARRRRKTTNRWIPMPPELGGYDDTPEHVLRRQLVRSIGHLAMRDRELIVLEYYLGLSQREMSETLGVPLGTVKSRTHRAVERLRAAFDAEERR